MDATAQALQAALAYVLMPIWIAAGFGDWLCHRVQRIEHSAGLRESLLHWAMIAELGVGIAAAALLEIGAGVLALLVVAAVAHEATMWCDLLFATRRRVIPVPEQWVHGVQTVLPWTALAALMVIHREQAAALVGWGGVEADWGLRFKDPLPLAGFAGLAAAATVFVALPFAEEAWRCARAKRERERERERQRRRSASPAIASPAAKLE